MHASSSQHRTAPITGGKDGEQPPGALGRNSDQHDLAVCDQRPATAASGHPPRRRSGRLVLWSDRGGAPYPIWMFCAPARARRVRRTIWLGRAARPGAGGHIYRTGACAHQLPTAMSHLRSDFRALWPLRRRCWHMSGPRAGGLHSTSRSADASSRGASGVPGRVTAADGGFHRVKGGGGPVARSHTVIPKAGRVAQVVGRSGVGAGDFRVRLGGDIPRVGSAATVTAVMAALDAVRARRGMSPRCYPGGACPCCPEICAYGRRWQGCRPDGGSARTAQQDKDGFPLTAAVHVAWRS